MRTFPEYRDSAVPRAGRLVLAMSKNAFRLRRVPMSRGRIRAEIDARELAYPDIAVRRFDCLCDAQTAAMAWSGVLHTRADGHHYVSVSHSDGREIIDVLVGGEQQ
jgi:hypothetical protein